MPTDSRTSESLMPAACRASGVHRRMRHRRRMRDEALHAAERFREREVLEVST